jgi:FAD/FMN-containing dehydrogenase
VSAQLLSSLRELVGTAHVLTGDPARGFEVDWTRRFGGPSLAVVRPADTREVALVLSTCSAAGVPVIPQGGNTGLVGGGVPATTGPLPVILSTTRLNTLAPVDVHAGQVTVGAGATLDAVQRHANAAGWSYGVDLAARDSATIGGTVATNAGGIRVIAHGMTRSQVVGVEAVLADGTVISHLSGLVKDNTGYDLAALLCGSEGTLAVITAVRLRLVAPPTASTLALVGVDSFDAALTLLAAARQRGTVVAAECVDATGMELVCAIAGLPWPLEHRHPLVVFLETQDGGDGSGLPLADDDDAVVATDAASRLRLWEYRERQSEAFSSLGVLHKLDVSVPLDRLAAFAAALPRVVGEAPDVLRFGFFGHLGDGNLHVEIAGPAPHDSRADRAVLELVAEHGGSISAEHGIGRAKANDLELSRSPAEIALMRATKTAWDPSGQLNPGVLFA